MEAPGPRSMSLGRWVLGALLVLALAVLVGGGSAAAGAADVDGGTAGILLFDDAPPANESAPSGTETTDGPLEVTSLANRTLPLRNARAGQNELGLVPGEMFATVVNRGTERATRTVSLHRIDPATGAAGPAVNQATVTLDPGDRTRVRLVAQDVILAGPGEYRLRARVGDSSADGRFWIYYPDKTFFLLTTAETPTVAPGASATIRVRVRNTGQSPDADADDLRSPGRVSLTALVDGRTVTSTVQWLEVNETREIPLTVPASALSPGSNQIEIRSGAQHDHRLDMLIQPVVVVEATPTSGGNGPGFGLAVALVAILAAIGAARVRRP